MPLTARQRRFVEEFALDLNATKAAERAGYSRTSAYNQGGRLMKNDEVRAEIARLHRERSARTGVTADAVVRELARIAFADLRNLFWDDGTLKPPGEWDGDTAAAVITFQSDAAGWRVRMADKLKALELLGRHLGMFGNKLEGSGPNRTPREVQVYIPDNGRDHLSAEGHATGEAVLSLNTSAA